VFFPVALWAGDCPTLTYGALPLGRDRIEVLAAFRAAGCDVREQTQAYPDGLFLIETESIQVRGLPSKRPSARITCACWAHVHHADLVFAPTGRQSLYLVERRIDESETDPRAVMEKFRKMLDPLVGSPGKPKFQDHRVKEVGSEYRYRTHFVDWYDWKRDVRSYLIVKELPKQGVGEVYVGHIWMPVIEGGTGDSEASK
jgi:hypothetical protein